MDNWKLLKVNHPKKGLVTIASLSNNEKGRAIVDLSKELGKVSSEHQAYKIGVARLQVQYLNHIASIEALSNWEVKELYIKK